MCQDINFLMRTSCYGQAPVEVCYDKLVVLHSLMFSGGGAKAGLEFHGALLGQAATLGYHCEFVGVSRIGVVRCGIVRDENYRNVGG